MSKISRPLSGGVYSSEYSRLAGPQEGNEKIAKHAFDLLTYPSGVSFTKEEKKKLEIFHKDKVSGHIRHYPIPLTRRSRPDSEITKITATQYRKCEDTSDDWVVDPDMHGEVVEQHRVSGEIFAEARSRAASEESLQYQRGTMGSSKDVK
jgi:hypothetical protein